jgi:hypothetical protein
MIKEMVIIKIVGGLIYKMSVVRRECMEDDAHLLERAIHEAQDKVNGPCFILAVDAEIKKSRVVWATEGRDDEV